MPILTLAKEILVPIEHKTFIYCVAYHNDTLSLTTKHDLIKIDMKTMSVVEVRSEHNFLQEVWCHQLSKLKQIDDNKILTRNQYKIGRDEWRNWEYYPLFRNEIIYREQAPIPNFTKLAHHKYQRLKIRNFTINGEQMIVMLKRREKTTKSVLHVYADKYNLVENIINEHTNNVTNIEMLQLPKKQIILMTVGFLSVHNIKAIYKPIPHYVYTKRDNPETMDVLKIGFWNVNVNYWYPLRLIRHIDETTKRKIQTESKDSLKKVGIVTCAALMSRHNVWIANSVDDMLCDVLSFFID